METNNTNVIWRHKLEMHFVEGMLNQEGRRVNRMYFVEKEHVLSVENIVGTSEFKWYTDDRHSCYGMYGPWAEDVKASCFVGGSMTDVLDKTAGDSLARPNRFYAMLPILEYLYSEKSKMVWKTLTDDRRREYCDFFQACNLKIDEKGNSLFPQIRNLWNKMSWNFMFLRNLKGQEIRRIVRVLESYNRFEKGKFYLCVKAGHFSLCLMDKDGTRWIPRSAVENGDAIPETEQGDEQ